MKSTETLVAANTSVPPPSVEPPDRQFPWISLVCGVAVASVFLVSLYPPFGTALFGPPLYPLALAAFIFMFITAAIPVIANWKNLPTRPERWALPFAAAVCLALPISRFPDRAAFPSLVLLLLPTTIIAITALVAAAPDRSRRCLNLFRLTAIAAIGISLWGLFSWAVVDFGTEVGNADHIFRITGLEGNNIALWSLENPHPFGHKNFVAGFAILTLPILFLLTFLDRSRLKLLWLGGLPLVLLYLASAESRAGWLAVAGGAAFYISLRFLRAKSTRLGWRIVPILLVVAVIPFIASPRLRESVQRMGEEKSLSAIDPYRWQMAQTGLAVGNAQPFTGVGSGALSLVSPAYSASANYPVVYQVHSTPIQLYSETGIAGLAGVLVLAWGLFGAWRKDRKQDTSLTRPVKDASAASILAFSAFALTDYQFDVPAIILAAAVPAGALLGLGGGSSTGPSFPRIWWGIGILTAVLMVPLFWFNGNGLLARRHLHNGMTQLNAHNVEGFVSETKLANVRASSDPFYLNQLANVWMTEWLRTEDATERNQLAEKALTALEQSAAIAPAQDSVHFNSGVLLRFQKKPQAALEAFEKSLEYSPKKRFAWLLSGQSLLELNRADAAAEAFARELLVNPSSLFLPLWQEPEIQPHLEARNRHFERLLKTHPATPSQRYFFYWSIGKPQPFKGNLDRQDAGTRVLITALEGNPAAAVELAPFTSQAFLVRAWIESDEAEKWLRAAFFQANRSAFSHENLQIMGERLRKADNFADAFRSLVQEPGLPMTPKQGNPRASGLFERNFYGAPLLDFHIYYEPIVHLLF